MKVQDLGCPGAQHVEYSHLPCGMAREMPRKSQNPDTPQALTRVSGRVFNNARQHATQEGVHLNLKPESLLIDHENKYLDPSASTPSRRGAVGARGV